MVAARDSTSSGDSMVVLCSSSATLRYLVSARCKHPIPATLLGRYVRTTCSSAFERKARVEVSRTAAAGGGSDAGAVRRRLKCSNWEFTHTHTLASRSPGALTTAKTNTQHTTHTSTHSRTHAHTQSLCTAAADKTHTNWRLRRCEIFTLALANRVRRNANGTPR